MKLFPNILAGLICFTFFLMSLPVAWADIDRTAVVFVEAQCRNPDSGAVVRPKGSGVIISETGHILTAAHVVRCVIKGKQFHTKAIEVVLGSPRGQRLPVDIFGLAAPQDVAILKIAGVPTRYKFLEACRLPKVKPETPFAAYGFPEGGLYQPVPGLMGVETPEGLWGVVSSFVRGMSGGPVVIDGYVVGLIKSGAGSVIARRKIIPIFRAASAIMDATGHPLPHCEALGTFSIKVEASVIVRKSETRTKTSRSVGVSTGSLVETKCQEFSFAPTNGWQVKPDTAIIVNRIEKGSSRASIVTRTSQQIIAQFCARSRISGFDKKTGDSFGAVRFEETRTTESRETRTFKAKSQDRRASIKLPVDVRDWAGEIIDPSLKDPLVFSSQGNFGRYHVQGVNSERIIVTRK